MNGSITAKIPSDLRSNATATRGAFRRATLELCQGASLAETKAKIDRVLIEGANIHNPKAYGRMVEKLRRILGDRLLLATRAEDSRRLSRANLCFFVVEPLHLAVYDLKVFCETGYPLDWRIEDVANVTRHAVERFVERSPGEDISLKTVALAAAHCARFPKEIHKKHSILGGLIPAPGSTEGPLAILDIRDNTVVTFLRRDNLGRRRADWLRRFEAFSVWAIDEGGGLKHHLDTFSRIYSKGAAIFAETRGEEVA